MKTDPLLDSLGQRLCRLRQGKGLTQADLAGLADLDPRYYGRIERGELNVTYLTLMRIARALDVCPGAFLHPPEDISEIQADVCAMIHGFGQRKERRFLAQTLAFLRHVLGCGVPAADADDPSCPYHRPGETELP